MNAEHIDTGPLFLDCYEGENSRRTWCWKNLETDESSQEFSSEEAALEAWRRGQLRWSRLDDLGD
jgi:hypothetical protein